MSELLGLYVLLRHFVCMRNTDAIREDVHLFDLTCRAVDLVLLAKKRRMPVRDAGRQLLAVLEEYMQQRAKLHGNSGILPKHHWAVDIAQCMVSDGFVVDAFALERIHLRAKAVAENCKNLRIFESTVMAGIANAHFGEMVQTQDWSASCHLLGALARMPGAPNVVVADRALYHTEMFAVGDFVYRGFWVGGFGAFVFAMSRSFPPQVHDIL